MTRLTISYPNGHYELAKGVLESGNYTKQDVIDYIGFLEDMRDRELFKLDMEIERLKNIQNCCCSNNPFRSVYFEGGLKWP